jgi:pimeloyl-ACP methyl ester carboxylesterase
MVRQVMNPMIYHKIYRLREGAPWVVFVHGAGGSSSIWYRQIRDFKEQFNVLLLDLRGHGKSQNVFECWQKKRSYTFQEVTEDIAAVLDHQNIQKAHFIGISLGTIIIRVLAEMHPDRVESMTMGGAVIRFNTRSKFLLWVAHWIKRFVPYMWIYKLYAWILMPKKKHELARNLFVREARKLYQKEFIRWIRITTKMNALMRNFRERELSIPTLYLMGDEDHMFLPSVKKLVEKHKNSVLHVVQNSGHVCNVDQPGIFNQVSINFIRQIALA